MIKLFIILLLVTPLTGNNFLLACMLPMWKIGNWCYYVNYKCKEKSDITRNFIVLFCFLLIKTELVSLIMTEIEIHLYPGPVLQERILYVKMSKKVRLRIKREVLHYYDTKRAKFYKIYICMSKTANWNNLKFVTDSS